MVENVCRHVSFFVLTWGRVARYLIVAYAVILSFYSFSSSVPLPINFPQVRASTFVDTLMLFFVSDRSLLLNLRGQLRSCSR